MLVAAALASAAVLARAADANGAPPAARPASSLEIRGSGAMGQLARALAESYMAEHADGW